MLYDDIQALDAALVASGDYQAIADAINATRPPVVGKVERAEFAMWAAGCGMRSKIEDHAVNLQSPLRDAALACRDVILGAAESIDLSLLPNQIMLGGWVAMGELTTENRDALIALATKSAEQITAARVASIMTGGA